eukprot:jgi/Ulvmu1/12265/UM086_0058.1
MQPHYHQWAQAVAAVALCTDACHAFQTTQPIPCTFPKAPSWPAKPTCPPTTLTAADAEKLAWRFAPELRFHPLDDSLPIDPADWFGNASMHVPSFLIDDPSAPGITCADNNVTCSLPASAWQTATWQPNATDSYFAARTWVTVLENPALSDAQRAALIAGAPVNAQNRSTASVVYTLLAEQNGNAWIFQYHPYYAWNGCSNQLLSLKFGDHFDIEEYFMCPEGVHESDFETIGVYVCPADLEAANGAPSATADPGLAIRRVQYSQHGWVAEYNCDAGECPFESGALSTSGLVAYAGLFSHAHYPSASSLWVYSQKRLSFLQNMDGIFIADRTAGTPTDGRRWVATASNTRFIPRAERIAPGTRDSWALFAGNFGRKDLAIERTTTLTCLRGLSDPKLGHMEQGPCEPSAPLSVLRLALGGATADNTSDAIVGAVASEINRTDIAHLTGPLQREYSYRWQIERGAPIWDDLTREGEPALLSSSLECPASSALTGNIDDGTVGAFHSDSISNVLRGAIITIVLSALLLVLLLLAPTLLWDAGSYSAVLFNATEGVRGKHEAEEARHDARRRRRETAMFGCFVFLTLLTFGCGVGFTAAGLDSIFGAANVTCGSDVVAVCSRWDSLNVDYILWGAFFFLFSHFLLFMFCMSNMTLLRLQSAMRRTFDTKVSSQAGKEAQLEGGKVYSHGGVDSNGANAGPHRL